MLQERKKIKSSVRSRFSGKVPLWLRAWGVLPRLAPRALCQWSIDDVPNAFVIVMDAANMTRIKAVDTIRSSLESHEELLREVPGLGK